MNDLLNENLPLAVFGLNHHTAALEIREKASMNDKEGTTFIRQFTENYDSCGVMLLSTCNRTEIYVSGRDAQLNLSLFCRQLDKIKRAEIFCNEDNTYTYYGKNAVLHFFKVISGLDSQMIGEPQITGQVKNAYEKSLSLDATDIYINKLYHVGMQAEKKVKNSTYLTDGAVSVSFAGVELARKIFSDLQKHKILLIGAGETAELAASHFLKRDVRKIVIVNRTFEKARNLAQKLNGEAVHFENLNEALLNSDIVISATSSDRYVISKDMLREVAKKRDYKPMFLIDLAIPRDIDPDSRKLDGVYLYDMDSLQEIVDSNIRKRKAEIPKAEKIIRTHADLFMKWYEELPVSHTITKLSSFFEQIRKKEYERLKKRFSEENRADAEYLTKSLMKKFLHLHITTLKHNNNSQIRQRQHMELLSEIWLNNGLADKNEETD